MEQLIDQGLNRFHVLGVGGDGESIFSGILTDDATLCRSPKAVDYGDGILRIGAV
jgi:hypothetical protein